MNNKREKNCKNDFENIKSIDKIKSNIATFEFNTNEIKLLAWIKTVLCAKRFLPSIIRLIDKNVFEAASSSSFGSFIFDDRLNGTYAQIEQLIEMEDRKLSLINMNMIAENLYNCLEKKYRDFVELKFFKNKNYSFVASELDIDERTLYRWNKIVFVKLLKYCKLNNWTTIFFENQLKKEKWLLPHFEKAYKSIMNCFGLK